MAVNNPSRLFNCPAETPFLKALAESVVNGVIFPETGRAAQTALTGIAIYLPSRHAVLPLQKEFLALSQNGATLLPRIFVLGETDPLDVFAFHASHILDFETAQACLVEAVDVSPAISGLERQLALTASVAQGAKRFTSEVTEPGEHLFSTLTPAAAFKASGEIAALIDTMLQDGVPLDKLMQLDSGFAAGAEQLSRQLLKASLKAWTAHKAKTGVIEPEERRNRLMSFEAQMLALSSAPVIVAGSTGSVAATANVMRALIMRGNGAVILPGLDRDLDDEGWSAVAACPEHPQHGLSRLLSSLGIARDNVSDLPQATDAGEVRSRSKFLSQALRPASATAAWNAFFAGEHRKPGMAAPALTLIEAETAQEEAEAIALILREAVETSDNTAAVISPDRSLLHRVNHALQSSLRRGSDPAAEAAGQFAADILAAANLETPGALLAALRRAHGPRGQEWRRTAEIVDFGCMRQMWRPRTFSDLPKALSRAALEQARHPAMQAISHEEWSRTRENVEAAVTALDPLMRIKMKARHPLQTWVAAYCKTLANLRPLGLDSGPLTGLLPVEPARLPSLDLDLAQFAALTSAVMAEAARDDLPEPHPRLFFWTPLDARLHSADTVILAGLNEGNWPQRPDPGPWLSARDRTALGMSSIEQKTGQSAHDFAMLAHGARRLFVTRAKKANGSLARPSRWIARLKVVAEGMGQPLGRCQEPAWIEWARLLREPPRAQQAIRPRPSPPLDARPRRLSVTALETLAANPYAIYARHILKLDPIREAHEDGGAREKGVLFHAAINTIFKKAGNTWPNAGAAELVAALDDAASAAGFDLDLAPFWRPRFKRFLEWFGGFEEQRRHAIASGKSEASAKFTIELPEGPFDITARADRVDILKDGTAVILDFKTSANAATNSIRRHAPQLSLEGYLASEGAFAGIGPVPVSALAYIAVTGGEPPGAVLPLKGVSSDLIANAKNGVIALLSRFDDPATPYAYEASLMFKDKADYDPYAHLARVREWSAPEEADDE